MKTYKLWIEIEEYDDETDSYTNMSDGYHAMMNGSDVIAEPVPLGAFNTIKEASDAAEALCDYYSQGCWVDSSDDDGTPRQIWESNGYTSKR